MWCYPSRSFSGSGGFQLGFGQQTPLTNARAGSDVKQPSEIDQTFRA